MRVSLAIKTKSAMCEPPLRTCKLARRKLCKQCIPAASPALGGVCVCAGSSLAPALGSASRLEGFLPSTSTQYRHVVRRFAQQGTEACGRWESPTVIDCWPVTSQDMAANGEEWEGFWTEAGPRLRALGYNSAERGTFKFRLLALPLPARRAYFQGDDDEEVRATLNLLLRHGGAGFGAGMAAVGTWAAYLLAARRWWLGSDEDVQRWSPAHWFHIIFVLALCVYAVFFDKPMTLTTAYMVLRELKFAVGLAPPDRWEIVGAVSDWVTGIMSWVCVAVVVALPFLGRLQLQPELPTA